jgi:hypothetical protein
MAHKLYIVDDYFDDNDEDGEGGSNSRLPFAHDIALLLLDKPVSTSRPLIRLPPSKSASRGLWALTWANPGALRITDAVVGTDHKCGDGQRTGLGRC